MSRVLTALFVAFWYVTVDASEDGWLPMWNAVLPQSSGVGKVPLAILVDAPSTVTRRNGVSREMVEKVIELGLRRNNILAEAVSEAPRLPWDMSATTGRLFLAGQSKAAGRYASYLHVIVMSVEVELLAYRIEFRLQAPALVEASPRFLAHDAGEPGTTAWGEAVLWTHGMLGYVGTANFSDAVRRYLSETTDLFSLDYLEAQDEVEAYFARQ